MGELSTKTQKVLCTVAMLAVAWASTVQAKTKPPVYVVDDETLITSIEKITILPLVVVAELDKKRETKLLDDVRKKLALELAVKGYVLKRANEFAPDRKLTSAEVAAMSSTELATLGPVGSRHIVLCFLNAIETSSIVIAESAETRAAAVLIDKKTGQVLWQNEVNDRTTLSVIAVGIVTMWLVNEDLLSIYDAFRALFESFPEKPME